MQVNFVLFEGLTQLDLTGPYEVLVRAPGFKIDFVSKTMAPVKSDRGLTLSPTTTLANALACDLLVVPGGPGTDDAILDDEWIGFVKTQGLAAKYIFGVCTGSLLLGAAGLLKGKRSTCHWQARDFMPYFGAITSHDRMCIDGNIFTAGGVTSGIDMAIQVVALLQSEANAKQIQLQIEYDPSPPFIGGTPQTSEPSVVAKCLEASAARRATRQAAVEKAALKMSRG
jgi:cyclohexyl-isocyanide hydratase